MPPNREQSGVYAGAIITAIGALMIILPSLSDMDMMSGGYALQFIGLFVLITGLVTLWFYRARAAVLARIFAGEGLLAHWTLDPTQVQKHATAELTDARENNRGLFFITAILFVVIGIPVLVVPLWDELVFWNDPIALVIVGGYFAVIPLLGLFAWGMPQLAYRRTKFPPLCGPAGDQTTLALNFNRQMPPGSFYAQPTTYIPYVFCVTGSPVGAWTPKQKEDGFKKPTGVSDPRINFCGGSCVVIAVKPDTPPGTYTFTIDAPDGRKAQASFQHVNPTPIPLTPRP